MPIVGRTIERPKRKGLSRSSAQTPFLGPEAGAVSTSAMVDLDALDVIVQGTSADWIAVCVPVQGARTSTGGS